MSRVIRLAPLALIALSSSALAFDRSGVEDELKKIEEYKRQGLSSAALTAREQALRAKLEGGPAAPAPKKSKKAPVLQATKKHDRVHYLDQIRRIESDQEKMDVINLKLEEERHALAGELEAEHRDASKVSELRDRIDLLEWKKSLVQKRTAKNDLQSSSSAVKVSGMIDFYYGWSSNRGGNNGSGSSDPKDYHNTLRFYDNKANDFTVNLAEVTVSGTKGRTSYLVDLDFGEFAEQNAYNYTGTEKEITKHIGQANLTYDFDGKHTLTAGKMYSHVGYELAKPMDNWNYSRPFAFGFGIPFWHEGVALKGAYESGVRWGAFLYDRTDTHINNNRDKSYGLQFGVIRDRYSLLYNGITGPETARHDGAKRTIHNVNGQYNWSDTLSFAFDWVNGVDDNATGVGHKDQKWQSLVGYVNWKFVDGWRFAARTEWFAETTNAGASGTYRLGVDGSVTGPVDITTQTFTLAHNLNPGNEVRLEYRLDHGNNPIFWNRDHHLRKEQDTLVAAWMVKF